jgi:hypothetical protein
MYNLVKQPQMEQNPELLRQQAHSMFENWKRMRDKLSNRDADTQKLSKYLNIPCDIFIQILVHRGQAIVHSVYRYVIDVNDEMRFINEGVNPILSKINPPLMVDPVKWIEVIEYLRMSLRTQYQQPVATFDEQVHSRMLEQSPAPPSGRPIPTTRFGRLKEDIPSVPNELDNINARIVDIFNTPHAVFPKGEDKTTPKYYKKYQYYMLISNLMDTHKLPSVTPEEYAQLFGDVQDVQHTLQPTSLLLELFNTKFPHLDAGVSLAFACRAYIDADQDIIAYLISLEKRHPKTFYVIARLMHSYATNVFDRNSGKHLGGKSRSKKRGRKSVHRRKKSAHNKRR